MARHSKEENVPFISVVMPAYNAGGFIGEVIATIIEQTFTDFELIIIDDGSTDNTAEVIKKYASIDPRIKYHRQKNQGSENLGETINKGVSFATGEWVARADADDPWYLDKLEKQVDFIVSHPDCILLGGSADIVDERGVFMYHLLGPLFDDDNKRALNLYTAFAHGSVVFRKSIFDIVGGYKNIHAVEDLDLWQRMSSHGKIYNIIDPLFKYRKNTQGISLQNQELQTKAVEKLGVDFFKSNPPKELGRTEFKRKLHRINKLRSRQNIPDHFIDWSIIKVVDDNIRIARLFIKYGDKKAGIRQLLSIATSGRVGLKMITRTIMKNFLFRVSSLWKKA